ncbi:hypothetical protein BSKO_07845 [Bryopsis sp. KO-2023]|nr:hypothetical protein BSKO_07845 [Bryopsis sp. KO-2023]
MFRTEEGYRILRRLWEAVLGAGRGFLRSREIHLQGAEVDIFLTNSCHALPSLRWGLDGSRSRCFWPMTIGLLPDVDGNGRGAVGRWGPIDELDFGNPCFSSLAEIKRFVGTMAGERYVPPRGRKKAQDDRVILLFDLNGTLVCRGGKKKRSIKLRPGLHHLWRLKTHFRIGIFTSAAGHNSQRMRHSVESGISNELDKDGLFDPDLILCRDHTRPKARVGGKRWDTMKPLGPLFSDLSKVILFDDDAYKAAKGEERNMVILPSWKLECPRDDVMVHLANILTEKLANFQGGDVRRWTSTVTDELARRSTPPSKSCKTEFEPSMPEVQGKNGEGSSEQPDLTVENGGMVGKSAGSSSNAREGKLSKEEVVEVAIETKGESVKLEVQVVEARNDKEEERNNVVPLSQEFKNLGVGGEPTESKETV